jgi:hypothetical protein
MSDSLQWKRVCQVIAGKLGGKGILAGELGDGKPGLRVQFQIVKTVQATPNTALIKIFNLNPEHEQQIHDEYDDVSLNAGYEDAVRLIFRGNIRHVFRYRDHADRITEIDAADGDRDYRHAVVNVTLAAGTSNQQLIDKAAGSFASTTKGYIGIPDTKRLRGRVISGMTREVLHDLAQQHGANWSIQDGQLVMVSADDVLPGQAIVINASTGMLGAPEISDKGIKVKCMLNPQLKVNGKVQLNNADIMLKQKQVHASGSSTRRSKRNTNLPQLDKDGIYKIIRVEHKGDTRGNDWYSELICIGLSQPIPKEGYALSSTELD